MIKFKFDLLIKSDIDKINALANFSVEQQKIFKHLCQGRFTDNGIAMECHMCRAKYYQIKKTVIAKCTRIIDFL